ncbi:MAG: hypothetical protein LBM60_09665 [Clostridium sp.]|nr:hypothetical protein [Clostridium sp.]
MGRDTRAMQSIKGMYDRFNLDHKRVLGRTKLILSIYRDVVWASLRRADELYLESNETLGHDLNAALTYLSEFAPDEKRCVFEAKVGSLFETKWYIDLIDMAMRKVYDYHMNGKAPCRRTMTAPDGQR